MDVSRAVPAAHDRANFNHLVWDIIWFGLALPATTRFLSVFAIRLGADANELTWLASAPALVLVLTASLGNWWLNRFPDSRKALQWPTLGYRLVFLLPALTPFLPPSWQPAWLILSVTLPAVPQGLAWVVFMVLMRDAVSENQFPPLLSRRSMYLNLAVAASGLALGVWLERVPFPLNYQFMFVLAFLFALASMWHVMRLRVNTSSSAQPEAARPVRAVRVNPWRLPQFVQVAFVTATTHIGFFSALALIPLHLVDEMGASEGFISMFALVELLAGAAVSLVASTVMQRVGTRNMIALGMYGTAIGLALIALAPSLNWTLLASAIIGASWTLAAVIGLFQYFAENTPKEGRGSYTTAYTQVLGVSMFIGPLVGSSLHNLGFDLVAILLASAMLRLLAGVLTQVHLGEWFRRNMHSVWLPR